MPEHAIVHFPTLVRIELEQARKQHGHITTHHHAYGLIAEETHEFFLEVCKKERLRSKEDTLRELVQIAACAQRAAEDLKLLPWPSSRPLTHVKD